MQKHWLQETRMNLWNVLTKSLFRFAKHNWTTPKNLRTDLKRDSPDIPTSNCRPRWPAFPSCLLWWWNLIKWLLNMLPLQTNHEKRRSMSQSSQTYNKAITATFRVTFDQKFLLMQLFYGGKTKQSIPKVHSLSPFL